MQLDVPLTLQEDIRLCTIDKAVFGDVFPKLDVTGTWCCSVSRRSTNI
jgi:hypothetical protein